jgi:hypothetical protein
VNKWFFARPFMHQQPARAQVGVRYSAGRRPLMAGKPAMSIVAVLVALASAGVSAAQSGRGGPYVGPMFPPDFDYGPSYGARDPREGKVETATFLANSASVSQLGHGLIVFATGAGNASSGPYDGDFESALVDQLAKAGYRTDAQSGTGGQTIEFVVSQDVVRPPEPPHNPVGGAVSAGVGSHGWGGVGMGLSIDLSKPLKALVATRLEARIRDSATQELLWQGRAQVVTRDGDKRWTPQAIAKRLTTALFKDFPKPS